MLQIIVQGPIFLFLASLPSIIIHTGIWTHRMSELPWERAWASHAPAHCLGVFGPGAHKQRNNQASFTRCDSSDEDRADKRWSCVPYFIFTLLDSYPLLSICFYNPFVTTGSYHFNNALRHKWKDYSLWLKITYFIGKETNRIKPGDYLSLPKRKFCLVLGEVCEYQRHESNWFGILHLWWIFCPEMALELSLTSRH